jgi:hypothetical protein
MVKRRLKGSSYTYMAEPLLHGDVRDMTSQRAILIDPPQNIPTYLVNIEAQFIRNPEIEMIYEQHTSVLTKQRFSGTSFTQAVID